MVHQLPSGGANHLPNAFNINSLLELRKKLTARKGTDMHMTCPKHNDPLKVYCKTCSEIICRHCTISKQHNRHEFELISECYPKHYRQIQDELGLLEDKLAIVDKAVTSLVAREREVVEQGEEVKKQICTHAQKLIDRIRQSKRELLKKIRHYCK